MTIVHCPGARYHTVDVIKRVELFDFGGVDDLHAEADVIGNALHGVKPVEIRLLTRDANTARGMPAHVLAGLLFERRIETIPVVMDFGKVVVTNEARALPGCVPGRARGQLALLDQHDIGFAFLGKMIGKCHTHDAAPDNHNLGLRIDRHTTPLFLMVGSVTLPTKKGQFLSANPSESAENRASNTAKSTGKIFHFFHVAFGLMRVGLGQS